MIAALRQQPVEAALESSRGCMSTHRHRGNGLWHERRLTSARRSRRSARGRSAHVTKALTALATGRSAKVTSVGVKCPVLSVHSPASAVTGGCLGGERCHTAQTTQIVVWNDCGHFHRTKSCPRQFGHAHQSLVRRASAPRLIAAPRRRAGCTDRSASGCPRWRRRAGRTRSVGPAGAGMPRPQSVSSVMSSGTPAVMPDANRLGAMASTRIPRSAQIAGHGQAHAGDRRLGRGVRDQTRLPSVSRQRCGVDDDPALVVLGGVAAHVHRRQPADIEGGHRVQINHRTEGFEVMWPGTRRYVRPPSVRTPARGRHRNMQATEVRHRLLQDGFGPVEVGDLDRVEPLGVGVVPGPGWRRRRHARSSASAVARPRPRRAADDHGLLAGDDHVINPRAPVTQGRSRVRWR